MIVNFHQLVETETGYECQNCQQVWKNKPRKSCPGVPIVEMGKKELEKLKRTHWSEQKYWLIDSLAKENLRPITKIACVKQGKDYLYLYAPQGKTEKIDPNLPPVVEPLSCDRATERITDSHCLKSELGLKKLNLIPIDAKPVAVYWQHNKFIPLYNPKSCQIYIKDFPKEIDNYRGRGSKLLNSRKREAQNLKPKPGEKPLFAYWDFDDWELLYAAKQCEIDNLDLPPVVVDTSYTYYEYEGDLLNDYQLKLLNLKPRGNMKPVGCYKYVDKWVMLWDIKQCEQIDKTLPWAVSEIPKGWYKEKELARFNRQPNNPIGSIFDVSEKKFVLLYRPEDCALADINLPPIYDLVPNNLCYENNLASKNRQIAKETVPRGVIWHDFNKKFAYLYDPTECPLINPDLPPIVSCTWDFDREYETRWKYNDFGNALKSKLGLKKLNLMPINAKPVAVYWNSDGFEPLYNPLDCTIRIHDLPLIISRRDFDNSDLLDDRRLKLFNLKPRQEFKAIAVYWNPKTEDWEYLWDIKQCEPLDKSLPPVYPDQPDHLYFEKELARLNRKVTPQTKALACIKEYSGKYSLLYSPNEVELIDKSLPPCYDKNNLPPELKSEWAWIQAEPLFELKENAIAKGCFLLPQPNNKYEPVYLYERTALRIHQREVYLSKTKLKKHYKLSNSWLSKLGSPDKYEPYKIDNIPVEAHLYSRSRIEKFLAENAEEYIKLLNRRQTYLAIFEQNKDKLLSREARAKAKQTKRLKKQVHKVTDQFDWNSNSKRVISQSIKCLQCASGVVLDRGFCCAINPLGLELDRLPCPDWVVRE